MKKYRKVFATIGCLIMCLSCVEPVCADVIETDKETISTIDWNLYDTGGHID